jgi:CRP/FNR family cyclic AMP-dependent transcriptional regulator
VADPRIKQLRSIPLFSSCSERELEFIATRVEDMDIAAGRLLCEKGKSGGDFFVIISGEAEVDAADGKRKLGPGEFFGEIALIDDGPRTATVRSTTPMRCLVLSHDQFRDVLRQNAEIAVKVLHAVTRRLRASAALPTG